jgi:hypothetical protein
MSATSSSQLEDPRPLGQTVRLAPLPARRRIAAVASSGLAAVLGILPHVLRHAGRLAGAALLAGTAGSLLFGALGLIAAIPFLLRIHRRCGNWRRPAALLVLFVAVFSVSTFVVGPAITGGNSGGATTSTPNPSPAAAQQDHEAHHR